jgi:hypothetical protein
MLKMSVARPFYSETRSEIFPSIPEASLQLKDLNFENIDGVHCMATYCVNILPIQIQCGFYRHQWTFISDDPD